VHILGVVRLKKQIRRREDVGAEDVGFDE